MKEQQAELALEVIELIKDNLGIEPVYNIDIDLKSNGETSLESIRNVHYTFLLDIVISFDETLLLDVSFLADLKPPTVAEITHLLTIFFPDIVIFTDSFAYGEDGECVFGDEAEKIIAKHQFEMIEEEIYRREKSKNNPDIRYDLKWYREPSTH